MPPITKLDIITASMQECGVIAMDETPSSSDANFVSSKLDRLLDSWNADKLNIYTTNFSQFVIVPNAQPLTIGQAANIASASLTANVATYIAPNAYKVGQFVDVVGCTNATFNVTNFMVIGATPTQFQLSIVHADILSQIETIAAKSVFTGSPIPNYGITTQRPTKIASANIILNNITPNVNVPIRIRDDDWWAANSVRTVTSSIPTDLYYSPDWPNGSIYLWPKPSAAFGLEIWTWFNLAGITALTDPFYLPQGYWDGIVYSLAESICPAFSKPLDQTLAAAAIKARSIIRRLNASSPTILTGEDGNSGQQNGGTYFNWLNGSVVNR